MYFVLFAFTSGGRLLVLVTPLGILYLHRNAWLDHMAAQDTHISSYNTLDHIFTRKEDIQ